MRETLKMLEKVKYLPHDGVHTDRLKIGGVTLNHLEIHRLYLLLEDITFGTDNLMTKYNLKELHDLSS